MLQKELEMKLHNIMVDLYEKYSFDGRTEYGDYPLKLYSHDMENMMDLLKDSGVFTRIKKSGESKVSIKVDPVELQEWIETH